MSAQHTIRLFVIECDIYARQAITSYLSWDRHTRVVGKASAPYEMLAEVRASSVQDHLDVVVLDTSLAAHADGLAALVRLVQHHVPGVSVVCLAHSAARDMALAAYGAGARAYLVRERVGIGLASAVRFALSQSFVVTEDVADQLKAAGRLPGMPLSILPERRSYPRLTQRIEEALWLCVVEGLPAERAADEMGVSTSTVRSYIKEGYRILEATDDTVYPMGMSPSERAFLRFSALEMPDQDHHQRGPRESAA